MAFRVPEGPEIDFMILADKAEAFNGKLYMMGGGWDRLTVPDITNQLPINLAVGVLMPWNETNEDLPLTFSILDEDGASVQDDMTATVTIGRPPGAIRGQTFRLVFAATAMVKFPKYGAYCLTARVAGSDTKSVVFHLVPSP